VLRRLNQTLLLNFHWKCRTINFSTFTPNRPDQLWGPLSVQDNSTGVLSRRKETGAWCWPPTSTYSRGYKWVERRHLCSPNMPSWRRQGQPLPTRNLRLYTGHAVLPIRSAYKIINPSCGYRHAHWITIVVVFGLLERKTVPHTGNILWWKQESFSQVSVKQITPYSAGKHLA
jgi:hypothetical protein